MTPAEAHAQKRKDEENRSQYERMVRALYLRAMGLEGRFYNGCGFHYSLIARAARLISDFSPERYYQDTYHDIGMRIVVEVCADGLQDEIQRAEISAIRHERKTRQEKREALNALVEAEVNAKCKRGNK